MIILFDYSPLDLITESTYASINRRYDITPKSNLKFNTHKKTRLYSSLTLVLK